MEPLVGDTLSSVFHLGFCTGYPCSRRGGTITAREQRDRGSADDRIGPSKAAGADGRQGYHSRRAEGYPRINLVRYPNPSMRLIYRHLHVCAAKKVRLEIENDDAVIAGREAFPCLATSSPLVYGPSL